MPSDQFNIKAWREARIMECADDIRDMAQRVVNNGPEATYAEEKLLWAARCLVRALYHLGHGSDLFPKLESVMSAEADVVEALMRPEESYR